MYLSTRVFKNPRERDQGGWKAGRACRKGWWAVTRLGWACVTCQTLSLRPHHAIIMRVPKGARVAQWVERLALDLDLTVMSSTLSWAPCWEWRLLKKLTIIIIRAPIYRYEAQTMERAWHTWSHFFLTTTLWIKASLSPFLKRGRKLKNHLRSRW